MPCILHEPAIELVVELQAASRRKYEHAPNSLPRDALFIITHDAVRVHRAIGSLSDAGWAGPGAALLRTLLDLIVSSLAIVNSASPPMAAFRYLYSGFRRHSRDQDLPATARRNMFDQIRIRLRLLPDALRHEAIAVVREKDRPYWFCPEFPSPTAVLKAFAPPGMDWTYLQLSGTAHGTFFGLRLYREEPDLISINPDVVGRRATILDLSSSHLLVQLLRIRNVAEELGLDGQIDAFTQRSNAIAESIRRGPAV